jgi:CubicO group peptidase (beta-lactamase class C family)
MQSLRLLALLFFIFSQNVNSSQQNPLIYSTNPHDYGSFLDSRDFQEYIDNLLSSTHTPGLSIAILHKNNTWARGFGYAYLPTTSKSHSEAPRNAIPVTNRTLFHGGSTTKSFVAALTSRLVHSTDTANKDLTWDTKLVDLIREDFVLNDSYATNHISFKDALSHRTGLPGHDVSWLNGGNATTQREIVRRMRYLPLARELREGWEYCNLMFIAVGHAIETRTGGGVGKLMKEWIWKPLGMKDTVYGIPAALEMEKRTDGKVNVARPYLWDNSS